MSETVGEQYRCPECMVELGTPDTPVDVMTRIKAKHKGSKVCSENRKLIQYALGEAMGKAADSTASAAMLNGQNVIVTEGDDDQPALEETVVFESPTRFLRVRLKRSRRIWSPDGRMLDYIPAIYAEFRDGTFRTRDPWMVNALRAAPNNVEKLKRRGFMGQDMQMRKDRFYEVGAVTNKVAEAVGR